MKEIPLTKGCVALVDDEDYDRLTTQFGKWSVHERRCPNCVKRYAQSHIPGSGHRGRLARMHRVVMNAPEGVEVDHINGNGIDNRKENLRFCGRAGNARNMAKARGASRFKGVTRNCTKTRWQAQIHFEDQRIYLGTFDTEEQAGRAYDAKARELFGEFARLNFPQEVA